MIQIDNITLKRGSKTLLEEASARVEHGNHISLIGRNGAGKSSLIQLLIGNIQEDAGTLHIPKGCKIAHLAQELPDSDEKAFDFVRAGDQRWTQLQAKIQTAEAKEDGMALAELYAELEAIDGYQIDSRTEIVLQGLGFQEHAMQQPVSSFSGGWQMRLQLARVLMSQADILLLDEPTNHLDLETIIWLEQFLINYCGTLLIISHDRTFLDHVTKHTISMRHKQLKRYQGNYSAYAKQVHEALILQEKQNEKTIKKQKHLQKFVDRFKAKASKAKQAQSRIKAIEKLSISQDLQKESDVSFSFFESNSRLEGDLISLDGTLGYGQTVVLDDIKLTVNKGDRIGVIGVNGSGKSTLLKSIAQKIEPIKGKIILNTKTKIGYFSQQQLDQLRMQDSALAHLLAQDRGLKEGEARRYLGGFDFRNDNVLRPIESFSGGERARLALALLIWDRPNILVLDEPTNHLDMQVREALMLALQDFEGAVLLVSHDRYFIDCCVHTLWHIDQGRVKPYTGNLDDYAASQMDDAQQKPTKKQKKAQKKAKAQPDLKQLENDINDKNKSLEKIKVELAEPTLYDPEHIDRLNTLLEQQQKLKAELKAQEALWVNLLDDG